MEQYRQRRVVPLSCQDRVIASPVNCLGEEHNGEEWNNKKPQTLLPRSLGQNFTRPKSSLILSIYRSIISHGSLQKYLSMTSRDFPWTPFRRILDALRAACLCVYSHAGSRPVRCPRLRLASTDDIDGSKLTRRASF
jgi:hypothetical protein